MPPQGQMSGFHVSDVPLHMYINTFVTNKIKLIFMLRNVRKKLMKSFEQFSSHFGEDFSYMNLNLRIIMKFREKK